MISQIHTKLTHKQKEILQKIESFFRHERYFPSIRELNQILKIKSSNTTFSHLKALIKKGYLKKNLKGKIISLTNTPHKFEDSSATYQQPQSRFTIPYYPSGVPAGFQAPAADAEPERLTVDQYLIKDPSNTFALKVIGNSMEKAGIVPNDLLLVEKRSDARPQQIVIAHLPSGFTVKRLIEENGQQFLKAESSQEYQIQLEEGTEIWGIVVGIIRKY